MKWTVIYETDNVVYCYGVFDTFNEALGATMLDVWETKDSYTSSGGEFTYTDGYELEGESGYGITGTYKNDSKEHTFFHWYVLNVPQKEDRRSGR